MDFNWSKFGIKKGYDVKDKKEFSIVLNTLKKYKLPFANFESNLATLTINEQRSFLDISSFYAGSYSPSSNSLSKPEKSEDFIHELFHMASRNNITHIMGSKYRSGDIVTGDALNEGIIDYFTSLAVDDYTFRYPIEGFIAKQISNIYGISIFTEFFNGNAKKFYLSFGDDEDLIRSISSCLDDFLQSFKTNELYLDDEKLVKKRADLIADALVDLINDFISLLRLNNLDEKNFLNEFSDMLDNKTNTLISDINFAIKKSRYGGKENFFEKIKMVIEEDEFSL